MCVCVCVCVLRDHCRKRHLGSLFNSYSPPWIAPLTLDPYLIKLSFIQGAIKYYSLL